MTSLMSPKRGRFFASSVSLLDLTLPQHNDALAGDTLYSIQFNYEWRKIVASALQFYFRHDDTALALDNEDLLNNVLEDLYTAEAIAGMETRTKEIVLGANLTTTSTSYTIMLDTEFSHTFTKPNAQIRWTAFIVNSANNNTFIKPFLQSETGIYGAEGRNLGTTGRTITVSDTFEGIPAGSLDVALQMKVSAGTGTINSGVTLICEILEYD